MRYSNLLTCPDAVDFGRRMGWGGFCVVGEYGGGFKKFAEDAGRLGEGVLIGALLTGEVSKGAKKALELADLVIVDGRAEDATREASESWEVDLIVNPELNEERDLIRQRASGLDHVACAFMGQRNIGYCVNVDNILHTSQARRAQLLGRIMQNLMLARKYGVRVVMSCGASSRWDVRSPHALMALGRCLGMKVSEARDSVAKNPGHFLMKAASRSSPDVLTAGVEVRSWGAQERRPNRKHGWY